MDIDLKKIRAENGGLTQSGLAERLGIKLRTVQKYETGSPIPLSMEKLIAYEFNIDGASSESGLGSKIDVASLIESIAPKLSAKDARVLDVIKNEFDKQKQEKEAFKEKYYKTLEKLDKLKTYMIKSFKIPGKYLD